MGRPVIGISCYLEAIDRAPWVGQRSAVLPHSYIRHVESAGGLAVLLPPRLDADDELAGLVLDRLDGLIIAGGADIESSRYGDAPHGTAQQSRADRDSWEIALARVSAQRDLPVLGICRGMQVMAVAAGGRLEQHIPDRTASDVHSPVVGTYSRHDVTCVAVTALADILGTQPVSVPTYHHQAVVPDSLGGTTYLAAAWHADGTLEGMVDTRSRFRLAVQWHPEEGSDPRLFEALVAAAKIAVRV